MTTRATCSIWNLVNSHQCWFLPPLASVYLIQNVALGKHSFFQHVWKRSWIIYSFTQSAIQPYYVPPTVFEGQVMGVKWGKGAEYPVLSAHTFVHPFIILSIHPPIHPSMHPSNQYSLSTYYVWGNVRWYFTITQVASKSASLWAWAPLSLRVLILALTPYMSSHCAGEPQTCSGQTANREGEMSTPLVVVGVEYGVDLLVGNFVLIFFFCLF